jgi:hypothetical protein
LSNAAAVPTRAALGQRTVARGWIQSAGFDLALFTLAPLSGIVVVWASYIPGGYRLGILATFLVAIPHYMSSFSFYLGDDNLRYYRTRQLAFFGGPVVLFLAVVGLRLAGHGQPVQVTMFLWNIWHVALQSAGILAIYRRLNGGPASEQPAARFAILFTNAAMAMWFLERYAPLRTMIGAVHPLASLILKATLVVLAIVFLAKLVWLISRRPRGLSFPEAAFLVTSLLLFHPYLWVPDIDRATFAMLMGHFIQYLAIVWLLNHRKYTLQGAGSGRQRALAWMSASPATILASIAIVGTAFYAADRVTRALGIAIVYVIAWNAMTLIHFYVDGLVWAFRRPHVRQTVGPFLMPDERMEAR